MTSRNPGLSIIKDKRSKGERVWDRACDSLYLSNRPQFFFGGRGRGGFGFSFFFSHAKPTLDISRIRVKLILIKYLNCGESFKDIM